MHDYVSVLVLVVAVTRGEVVKISPDRSCIVKVMLLYKCMINYNPVRGNTLPDEIFYVVNECFLSQSISML